MGRDSTALLAAVNALWILQASLPLLDRRLPALLSFPLSQLLSLAVGALLVLCARSLLVRLSVGGPRLVGHISPRRGDIGDKSPAPELSLGNIEQLDPYTNSIFLALSSLWCMGLGIHAASVIVENELTPDDPLHPLVHHHLHRFWSHNMFGCGYFGLLLLLVWAEAGHPQPSQADEASIIDTPTTIEKTYYIPRPPTTNVLWFINVLWSIILGLIYTIVAKATHTVALTTTFYIASLCFVARKNVLWTMTGVTTSVCFSSFTGLIVLMLL